VSCFKLLPLCFLDLPPNCNIIWKACKDADFLVLLVEIIQDDPEREDFIEGFQPCDEPYAVLSSQTPAILDCLLNFYYNGVISHFELAEWCNASKHQLNLEKHQNGFHKPVEQPKVNAVVVEVRSVKKQKLV
jgi:hypothetical protein